jgi:hypothetical protein
MKNNVFLIVFVLILSNNNYGQKWTYSSGGNVFDGQYKTSSIIGTGGEFPYNNPIFVVNLFENEKLNVYVGDAGFAGCDNKIAYIKFDNSEELYTFNISTNQNKDIWFLNEDYRKKETSISIIDFLEKLKNHNILYIRLYSDCNQRDYKFSLSGSSVAINYVVSDYINKLKESEIQKEETLKFISSGKSFKTKAKFRARILYEQKSNAFYKDFILEEGEEIICSDYSPDNKFCVIKKATTLLIPVDSVFYINKFGVNLSFVEKIE